MKLTYATKKLEEAAKKFDSLDYDIIVCGIGYAGAIMTARVAERNPGKKVRLLFALYHVPQRTCFDLMDTSCY